MPAAAAIKCCELAAASDSLQKPYLTRLNSPVRKSEPNPKPKLGRFRGEGSVHVLQSVLGQLLCALGQGGGWPAGMGSVLRCELGVLGEQLLCPSEPAQQSWVCILLLFH